LEPESTPPNFIFLSFPIFDVKLSRFVKYENKAATIKWPSLIAKKLKNKHLTIKKKKLLGLIPGLGLLKLLVAYLGAKLSQVNRVRRLNKRLKVL
jgi:hypothetical protein